MRIGLITVVLIAILPGTAAAGGKYFAKQGGGPGPVMPYQRAIVLFDGEREVLVLQSVFEFPGVRDLEDFVWVLPLPADVKLHEVDPEWVEGVFWEADDRTAPRRYSLVYDASPYFCLGLAALIVLVSVLRWKSRWGPATLAFLLVPAVLYAALAIFAPERQKTLGVEERNEVMAGGEIFLTSEVVAAEDEEPAEEEAEEEAPRAILDWLTKEGFVHRSADREVLLAQKEQGRAFLVSRVAPTGGRDRLGEAPTGYCRTIAVEFPTREIVYPERLGTDPGVETELLLYVLAPHRVNGLDGLTVKSAVPLSERLADPGGRYNWERMISPFDREGLLALPWLTKLKGTLPAASEKQGLAFSFASKDEEMRPLDVGWK